MAYPVRKQAKSDLQSLRFDFDEEVPIIYRAHNYAGLLTLHPITPPLCALPHQRRSA